MVGFPFKRIFGLIGAPRTGKDSVANFLTETRDFAQMAFADQIKEEFGITKEDFEAAKIAGNIEELRERLWAFSAEKKAKDPRYFIKKVISKVDSLGKSVIITDIRTEDELEAFFGLKSKIKRVYWIRRKDQMNTEFDKQHLAGSKLSEHMLANYMYQGSPEIDMRPIINDSTGLYALYKSLDKYFFLEDIKDIYANPIRPSDISLYIDQFDIRQSER